ncbi:hypothetical protein HNP46_002710 [Pseudomonas nitritireducens]|uniref:Glycosyltransferase RgtA/B/C/D-like domain-containing protein n=1 Tax=Pseudomonas nitroreducens TaxID=46680 RepID=A0A7W7KJZ4_PSENT|nr:hypothetical protein [Pseudomonas nitritireducens]MBB4863850.1 hypothetical protein [Pseudomonas nitritireducens]
MKVATNEMGDFAANSLLIQDAKSFSLLVGNYSRVGFNHPGPAILYVLAAGEYVFFDKLGWVNYAFAGQLISVVLYNAFWLTLIAVLLHRMGLARHVVLAAVSAFCLATAIEDHSFFNGIWFPHLYFFPFAVLLLSLARLIQEKADSLWMLAISAGFLINGHASFIAILGLMLVIVLIYSFFFGAQRGGVLRPEFLKKNALPLFVAVVLLVLFFVPLIILTVKEFPGPLGDYLAFGGGHKPNKLKNAIGFVSLYWGGKSVFLAAIVVSALLWRARTADRTTRVTRSLLVVLLAATLAMLFYARYGVDYLEQTYIGLFYFSVPSIFAVALVTYAAQLFKSTRYALPVSVVMSAAALGLSFFMASKPPFYLDQYQGLQIVELEQALLKEKGNGGRLVLNLDDSRDWPHVWMVIVGTGAYAKRQSEDVFCVNTNWYISFSKKLKCTSEEVASNKRFVVRRSFDGGARAPNIDLGGISFFEYSPPASLVSGVLTIKNDRDLFTDYLLGSGWTVPDEMFTWSLGARAVIQLPPIPAGSQVLLELGAFLPQPDSLQQVTVFADGIEQGVTKFSATAAKATVAIKPKGPDGAPMQITLQIDHPISPSSVGNSKDTRLLGVALYGIEVMPPSNAN